VDVAAVEVMAEPVRERALAEAIPCEQDTARAPGRHQRRGSPSRQGSRGAGAG
jgi:hypothetical protein